MLNMLTIRNVVSGRLVFFLKIMVSNINQKILNLQFCCLTNQSSYSNHHGKSPNFNVILKWRSTIVWSTQKRAVTMFEEHLGGYAISILKKARKIIDSFLNSNEYIMFSNIKHRATQAVLIWTVIERFSTRVF